MKIRTITCHHVYNHGAYLQAYALVAYLHSLGHDAKIINYRPSYLRGHYNLWGCPMKYRKCGIGWLYILAKLPQRIKALKRKSVFDDFFHRHLPLTENEYLSIEELRNNPPEADCYIAGSDQIWNTSFKNGTDPGFFLDFGSSNTRRISYAASFATDFLNEGTQDFVKSNLHRFNRISVRESSGIKILSSMGFSGEEVVDPVFLLSSDQWNVIASSGNTTDNYILIYDFENSPEIRNIATRLSKLKSLKIYSISHSNLNYTDRNFINFGPATFVELVKNATCIISNSFHGSAFALLYNKDFFVVNRADGLNVRMRDLLNKYGLTNRIIGQEVTDEALLTPIDYSKINTQLENDIVFSKKYIINSITL